MAIKAFVRGVALGAGLTYLFDPENGKQRREKLRQKFGLPEAGSSRSIERRSPDSGQPLLASYGSRVGDIAGLEVATLARRTPSGFSAPLGLGWRVAGGALAFYGLTRRGALASLSRTLGAGLLMGSVGGESLTGSSRPVLERRRAVDIQKTLHIEAPLDEVYAFWSNYENFPLFMSHVREVEDLGGGRSHWSVSGPGGVPIEWDAMLTQQVPDSVIAWRSEPGSMLENAGVIRFVPDGRGTRVNLRICYNPPAGGAGQAVAELLGSDPRGKLNEDLGRMKALLEATTRREKHGQESQS
jgi:uncharacterized membrane protein